MKLWMIVFFLLPLVGICYVGWRLWHLLPVAIGWKILALGVLLSGFVGMFFYLRHGLDGLPRWAAVPLYESISSWPFVLLYLVLLFLCMDLLRAVGFLPREWMFHSAKGTLAVAALMVAIFTYGYFHYLHKVRVPLEITTEKGLKRPLKILLLSDLHLGYHNRRAEFSRWVDKLNAEKADLILIAGDIIDISVKPLMDEQMHEEFLRLNAPVYACLGNHEYYSGTPAAQQFYRMADITLLSDSVAEVNGLQIIGRDDRTNPHRKPLDAVCERVDPERFSILLDHQPYHLEEAERAGVDFQFSGHTHEGQVWPISWLTHLMYEKAFGGHERGKTRYYISSGMGIWGGKFRIGTQSEYVVLTLKPAK